MLLIARSGTGGNGGLQAFYLTCSRHPEILLWVELESNPDLVHDRLLPYVGQTNKKLRE